VRSRECGIVFQSYALFPHMTVSENVAYALRVRDVALAGGGSAGRCSTWSAWLSRSIAHRLSGGQQQRVAWREHWCSSRAHCCSMSRLGPRCRDTVTMRGKSVDPGNRTLRHCSSPMIRTKHSRSPIGSRYCAKGG
jgi:hypothetical protein